MGGANLRFTNLTIFNPQASAFQTHAIGVITNAGPFSGSLDPATFEIRYHGTLFGLLAMPSITIIGNQDSPVDAVANFTIVDMAVFNAMTSDMINLANITWSISASVTMHALGLPISNLTFEKDIVIPAAAGLKDVELLKFDLSKSTPTQVVLDVTVSIFNPSIVNIVPLGDLTFDLYYDGGYVGQLVSLDASLLMGNNSLTMTGLLAPENMTVASELFSRFLADQSSVVIARGASNASSIPLFSPALQGVGLQTVFSGLSTQVVQDLAFQSLSMTPVDNTQVLLGGAAVVTLDNPLGPNSPIIVHSTSMDVTLSSNNIVLGTMSLPMAPVTNGSQSQIALALDGTLLFHGGGENFVFFVQEFLQSESLTLTLSGTTTVNATTALGTLLLADIPVDLTVTLVGVNNFPQVSILSFNLPSNSPAGGIALTLQASLNNPSIATVPIGTMNLGLYYGSTRLGTVGTTGVTLVPGVNVLNLTGNIDPAAADLGAASEFFSLYVTGVSSLVIVRGLNAGCSPVTWVQQTVQAVTISTSFPGDTSNLIKSVSLGSLGMFFPGGSGAPTASSSAVADFALPFDFPFSVSNIATTLTISSNTTNVKFLQIPVPTTPAISNQAAGTLAFSFTKVLVSILDVATFEAFAQTLVVNSQLTVNLQGVATTTVVTAAGNLTLSGLSFSTTIPLVGFDSFLNPPIVINTVDVVGGTPGQAQLSIGLTMSNPSIVYGDLGGLTLSLWYNGEKVGTTTIADLSLPVGSLNLTGVTGYLFDNGAGSQSRALLTAFLEGTSSTLTMKGVSSTVTYLGQAINALSSGTTLPGLTTVLVPEAYMDADTTLGNIADFLVRPAIAPTELVVNNPFTAGFTITATNFNIYSGTTLIGTMDLNPVNIVIAGKSQTTTPFESVSLESVSLTLVGTFIDSLGSGASLDISGTMSLTIGTFTTTISYAQNNVKALAS